MFRALRNLGLGVQGLVFRAFRNLGLGGQGYCLSLGL